jgi:hypothetical protein
MSDAIDYCPECETNVLCHMERKCMSRDGQLDRIVATCRQLLDYYANGRPAQAGWQATIAAIDTCREIRSPETGEVLDAIVAAWTGEKP